MVSQIVAGQVCFDCTDVANAKRAQNLGVDPSQLEAGGLVKPGASNEGNITAEAIKGVLQSEANEPLKSGSKGTNVNITA